MVSKITRSCTIALVSGSLLCSGAGPETGCYFYELPSKINKVKAQLEIKSDTIMEFSVAFDAPKLNLPANTIVCQDEPYRFDTATSEMIVGEGVLSPCLQTLKSYTRGVVKTPLRIKWNPAEKVLTTAIVIPLRIPKAANCIQFATPTPSIDPSTDSTTSSTVSPTVSSSASVDNNTGAPRVDTTSSTTTPKSATLLQTTVAYVFLGLMALVASV